MGNEIHNVNETATRLCTDPRTVRRYIKRGWLNAELTKQGYEIKKSEISRFSKKMQARQILEGLIEEIYVLRRHNTAEEEVSRMSNQELSTIDLAVERYQEERTSYFKTLGINDSSHFLLGKEVASRLKIRDYHVVGRLIDEGYIEAEKAKKGKQFKHLVYDKSFIQYLGKDLNNPFHTSREAAKITGHTVYEIDRIAKRCGVGRKILDTKNSHYLFIYEDIKFFKAVKRGEIKL